MSKEVNVGQGHVCSDQTNEFLFLEEAGRLSFNPRNRCWPRRRVAGSPTFRPVGAGTVTKMNSYHPTPSGSLVASVPSHFSVTTIIIPAGFYAPVNWQHSFYLQTVCKIRTPGRMQAGQAPETLSSSHAKSGLQLTS